MDQNKMVEKHEPSSEKNGTLGEKDKKDSDKAKNQSTHQLIV